VSIEQGLGAGGSPVSVLVDVLGAVDPAGLVGVEAVEFMRACFRARNQACAVLLTALYEAGRAPGRAARAPGAGG
jgi:hypothetical protein